MQKGFTLIELLAVIVILAIIAVIAVPIVINIIDDSKKNASLRSADFYLDAVEMSVAQATQKNKNIEDKTYDIMSDGNICLKTYNKTSTSETCTDEDNIDDNEILKVEVNGEHPKEGTITINNGVIKSIDITLSEKRITKNDKGEIIYFPCTLISGEENTIGSKYECEVSPGVKYNFYVLSTMNASGEIITETTEDKVVASTNLIMDRNMCSDGTPTKEGKTCLVAWVSKEDYNDNINYGDYGNNNKGPITAMDYLYNATKDWSNIPNIEMNYTDEGNGYETIVTTDNITKITKKDGTAVTVLTDKEGYSNLKARLPYYSEVSEYDSTNKANAYLYDYLNLSNNIQTNAISGIYGYWTLSSRADYSYYARFVYYGGRVSTVTSVDDGNHCGVRAVINLKI